MERPDLTDDLIHFIRADTANAALHTLQAILQSRRLIGSARMVKGDHRVVCFSEAPLRFLGYAVGRGAPGHSRYQPIGIMAKKRWLYDRGGRPVIYQPDSEYAALGPAHQWRHVRFEPGATPPIDFTWEREWRIHTPELPFASAEVTVVAPSQEVLDWMKEQHNCEQDYQEQMYGVILGSQLAYMYREDFPWTVQNLRLDQLR